ncbi:MAG: XdhC family protein [Deltaproteobacteria bacterium]|nr:XdhC family protein [Deltaproteobacteria bacterium]
MWLEQLMHWTRQGIPCAMVTIVESKGSTPQGQGARMVVNIHDVCAGTVGGGGVEHHARKAAINAIAAGKCRLIHYVLNEDAWSEEDADTVVVGDCGGRLSILVEPIVAQKEIVIFGAGHVGEHLGKLCEVLGQPYRVFDSRPEYATKARFPGAAERVVAEWDHIAERIHLTSQSYCVIMTYGHQHDGEVLAQLLENPLVPYIGMMGSRNKVVARFKAITDNGGVIDDRVYSPIGLDIGQNNPLGIAFNILAEIQKLMNDAEASHQRITAD